MCGLQGETGGKRSSSESSPHGVRNCEHIFLLSVSCVYENVNEAGYNRSLCCVCTQILPGVRVIIVNPETKGPLGDSHLGEVTVYKLYTHTLQMASGLAKQKKYACCTVSIFK